MAEAIPGDRTTLLCRRDCTSKQRRAENEQDEAVSHHAGPKVRCAMRKRNIGNSHRIGEMELKANKLAGMAETNVTIRITLREQ
ncbi:hypothetical protein ACVOMS_18340 [Bradyrhizobium guangxiense]